jgi:hypothetical protein
MIRRLAAEERGAVVAWVVLWVPLLIVVATFVIDVGNWWTHRRHLQNQVDAGALAAGASYVLPTCQSNSTVQDTISDEAMSYSGTTRRISPGNSPTTRNSQLSNSSNVFVTINSTSYWDGPSSGPAPDYSDGGGPCFTHTTDIKGLWTDVKATERNLPWLIPFAGSLVPRIQARARVAVKKADIFGGNLPLAIPDVNPTRVRAQLVDECTGNVLGTIDRTRTDPAQQDLWTGTSPSAVTFPGPSGSCTGPNARNGRVSVRAILAGGTNINCGQSLVECYDGLFNTRVYSTPAAPQNDPGAWAAPSDPVTTFLPYVTTVDLDSNPLCFGYFTSTNCSATVTVTVVRGANANSFSVGEFDRMRVAYPGGTVDLTDGGGGVFSGSVPLSTGGPYPLSLTYHWQLRQAGPTWRGLTCKGSGSNPCEVTGDFGTIHRAFRAGPTVSGPVNQIELHASSSPFALLENVSPGYTDNVSVMMRLSGTLLPQSNPNDPVVDLRVVGSGPSTQALDCDPNFNNLRDDFAYGCTPKFKLNDGTSAAWNPCPTNWSGSAGYTVAQPWQCVHTQSGVTMGQFVDGMNIRLGNTSGCTHDNNWQYVGSSDPRNPQTNNTDPRAVNLFLVPYGAFSVSSIQDYPVVNVGLFYVTGYTGQGSNQDPCRPPFGNDDTTNSGDIVGHFFKRVGINDPDLVPTDEACAPNSVTPCVAVLVD